MANTYKPSFPPVVQLVHVVLLFPQKCPLRPPLRPPQKPLPDRTVPKKLL